MVITKCSYFVVTLSIFYLFIYLLLDCLRYLFIVFNARKLHGVQRILNNKSHVIQC